MDAIEFIKERNRMCKSFDDDCDCSNCPAYRNNCCNTFEWQEELVAIVEKWSAEHPYVDSRNRVDADNMLC
jgi:hypothetical protein